MKTILGMRPILCDRHGKKFRGHGVTRVMRKVVFHFCAECWRRDRAGCDQHMAEVTRPKAA